MTAIAWDGITLAGDRRVSSGSIIHADVQKIARINGCLIGVAGALSKATALMHWFRHGEVLKDFPTHIAVDAEMLVIRPNFGGVWLYENCSAPYEVLSLPVTIGSGCVAASVAMHCGKTARQAVAIAALFDTCVGDRIDTLTFEPT